MIQVGLKWAVFSRFCVRAGARVSDVPDADTVAPEADPVVRGETASVQAGVDAVQNKRSSVEQNMPDLGEPLELGRVDGGQSVGAAGGAGKQARLGRGVCRRSFEFWIRIQPAFVAGRTG